MTWSLQFSALTVNEISEAFLSSKPLADFISTIASHVAKTVSSSLNEFQLLIEASTAKITIRAIIQEQNELTFVWDDFNLVQEFFLNVLQ